MLVYVCFLGPKTKIRIIWIKFYKKIRIRRVNTLGSDVFLWFLYQIRSERGFSEFCVLHKLGPSIECFPKIIRYISHTKPSPTPPPPTKKKKKKKKKKKNPVYQPYPKKYPHSTHPPPPPQKKIPPLHSFYKSVVFIYSSCIMIVLVIY